MRIRIDGEEYKVTMPESGNGYAGGVAWCWNGNLLPGIEDITEYDEDGNEVAPEGNDTAD